MTEGNWTHAICDDCWDAKNPSRPSPRSGAGEQEVCCFCAATTCSGIYTRHDPALTLCEGKHG